MHTSTYSNTANVWITCISFISMLPNNSFQIFCCRCVNLRNFSFKGYYFSNTLRHLNYFFNVMFTNSKSVIANLHFSLKASLAFSVLLPERKTFILIISLTSNAFNDRWIFSQWCFVLMTSLLSHSSISAEKKSYIEKKIICQINITFLFWRPNLFGFSHRDRSVNFQ